MFHGIKEPYQISRSVEIIYCYSYLQKKDKHNVKSYLPISLTFNLEKNNGKIRANSLSGWYLDKYNLMNQFQSGFRKKIQLFCLQNTIRNALHNKLSVITISLDIEKAYDMLWKDGLLLKLLNQLKIWGNI